MKILSFILLLLIELFLVFLYITDQEDRLGIMVLMTWIAIPLIYIGIN